MKKRNKKGFTLAELLIVVAVIAVLAAIAFPIFSKQMDKAEEGVDKANARAIESMAVTEALATDTASGTYYGKLDANGNMEITMVKPDAGYNKSGSAEAVGTKVYEVAIEDYKVHTAGWVDKKS